MQNQHAAEIAQNCSAFSCSGQIDGLINDMGRATVRSIRTATREANEAAIRTAAAQKGFTARFDRQEAGWVQVELVRN